jgi:hypothetical protein
MPVLTEKQTAFLRALAQGAVPSEAYRIGFGHQQMRPWMRQSAHVLMRAAKMAPFVEAARADYRRHLEATTEAAAAAQAATQAALLAELGLSQERVVRELAVIAFADLSAHNERLPLKVSDKLAALGVLAKMLGLFDQAKDRAPVDNSLNLRIFIDGEEQGGGGGGPDGTRPRPPSPGADDAR